MILPDKHISFAESLLGLGSFVLENIVTPKNLDELWHEFEKVRLKEYPAYHSFDNLALTINMLYAVNLIEVSDDGKLKKINRI